MLAGILAVVCGGVLEVAATKGTTSHSGIHIRKSRRRSRYSATESPTVVGLNFNDLLICSFCELKPRPVHPQSWNCACRL